MMTIKSVVSKVFKAMTLGAVAAAPFFAFAAAAPTNTEQTCGTIRNLTGVFGCAMGLVGYFISLTMLLAFLFFFWGVAKFIKNNENEAAREEGRQFMIWGIIAIFVIFAAWGLVSILKNTFGIGTPQFNTAQQQSVLNTSQNLDTWDPVR